MGDCSQYKSENQKRNMELEICEFKSEVIVEKKKKITEFKNYFEPWNWPFLFGKSQLFFSFNSVAEAKKHFNETIIILEYNKINSFPKDRFVKIREAGSGGFGTVEFAYDRKLKKEVAIKIFEVKMDKDAGKKKKDRNLHTIISFFKEISILNTSKFFQKELEPEGFFEKEETDWKFKAFKLLLRRGRCNLQELLKISLSPKITSRTILNEYHIFYLLSCLVDALMALKANSYYYSDIKLTNIIYLAEPPWFSLIDYGSCKKLVDYWRNNTISAYPEVYTKGYESPEIKEFLKNREPRSDFCPFKSDVYSLGKVLEKILNFLTYLFPLHEKIAIILDSTLRKSIMERWDFEKLRDFLNKNYKIPCQKLFSKNLFKEELDLMDFKSINRDDQKKIFFSYIKESQFKSALNQAKNEKKWTHKDFELDRSLQPYLINSQYRLGLAYLMNDKVEEALTQFEEIIKENDQLGQQDRRLEREAFIATELLKSFEDNPEKTFYQIISRYDDLDENVFYFDLKVLLLIISRDCKRENFNHAEKVIDYINHNFVSKIPELLLVSLYTLNAKILKKRNSEKALLLMKEAKRIAKNYKDIDHCEIYYLLAQLSVKSKNFDKAISYLKKNPNLNPTQKQIIVNEKSAEAIYLLIKCLFQNESYEQALEIVIPDFTDSITQYPTKYKLNLSKIMCLKGLAYLEKGGAQSALGLFEESISIMLNTDEKNKLIFKSIYGLKQCLNSIYHDLAWGDILEDYKTKMTFEIPEDMTEVRRALEDPLSALPCNYSDDYQDNEPSFKKYPKE